MAKQIHANTHQINRRHFLQRTSVAAGIMVLGAPALLRGKGLNDKLNIGIIGAGGRGAGTAAAGR